MNIYDISKKAGVSIATVSRVLNHNTNVSEKTREKVLAVMAKSDYTPNVFARGLSMNTMRTIGLLCPDSSDSYIAEALSHMERHLREEGYDVLLCCTGYDLSEKQKYMQLLLSKLVDGIILIGSTYVDLDDKKNEYIRKASEKVPIAILNAALTGPRIFCTLCDDEKAMQEVVQSLLESGKRNILYLYNSLSYSANKKLTGYRKAHELLSLPVYEKYVALCPFSSRDLDSVISYLASMDDGNISYDAIITSDDHLAVAALKYVKSHGKSIPGDIQIVGFNNSYIARYCEPELSSIDNKLKYLCNQCISSLTGVLSGQEMPNKTVFSAELIRRETTLI